MEIPFAGTRPKIHPTAFVSPGAILIGRVTIEEEAGVWFHAVLRGDVESIDVGPRSNIQDGCILHTDRGFPLIIAESVTVGHRAVLHGCTLEEASLIGMGAVVLNGARIGKGALVAAGALVPEGKEIPDGYLAMGVPAKPIRPLGASERQRILAGAKKYVELAQTYRNALSGNASANPIR